jgi:hypothetical protein
MTIVTRLILAAAAAVLGAYGQDAAPLPGRGLAQHPFLYCGEWQGRSTERQVMYIIRDGRVVWTYTNPKNGELGDCTMLSNGNIVFSRQYGASEITPDKKIVWDYDGPKGTEIHTAYPVGLDRVLIMQNGDPAKLLIIRKAGNEVVKELVLPTKDKSTHGQFRHVRITRAGTFLAAHMDLGKVVEYSDDGKELWSVAAPSAWAAVRLKNGNTLISGNANGYVREVNPKGETVWEVNKNDLPGIALFTVQEVSRLTNGNTLINNWSGGLAPDFPLAYGKLWPAMDAPSVAHYNQQRMEVVAANPITAFQIGLQMIHRLLAVAILGAVAFAAWSAWRALGGKDCLSRMALAWLGLVLTQVVLGAATIWTNKAADIATAHVLVGALSLALGAILTIVSSRELMSACRVTDISTAAEARARFTPEALPPGIASLPQS